MKRRNIAEIYAQGLFATAGNPEQMELYGQELETLCHLLASHDGLKKIFLSPQVNPLEKKQCLQKICKDRLSITITHFLLFLIEKNRFSLLDQILSAYRRLHENAIGRLRVKFLTSQPPSLDVKKELIQRLKTATGKEIALEEVTDRSIKGGGILIYHNRILDASIKNKIAGLKHHLHLNARASC